MGKTLVPDTEACKICKIGSCCYEGTELTEGEVRQIEQFNPPVAKPWFRKIKPHEEPDGIHAFSTTLRNGTCVFQGRNNLCKVYDVRPHYCRDFPVEGDGAAPYYQHLCVLFHENWTKNDPVKKKLLKREKSRFLKDFVV